MPVEYYNREKPVPPLDRAFVSKISLPRNIFGVVFMGSLLPGLLWVIPRLPAHHVLLFLVTIPVWFLFFVLGINEFLFQRTFTDWILLANTDLVIIKLGVGQDSLGRFPVAIGIPMADVETVRGIIQYQVKRSISSFTREPWAYLEFALREPAKSVSLPTDIQKTFFGITALTEVITYTDGTIRVLWYNNGFHVKPGIRRVVKHFDQYTKTEITDLPDKRVGGLKPNE